MKNAALTLKPCAFQTAFSAFVASPRKSLVFINAISLFAKEVVDELKEVANQPKRHAKANGNVAENGNGDSSY